MSNINNSWNRIAAKYQRILPDKNLLALPMTGKHLFLSYKKKGYDQICAFYSRLRKQKYRLFSSLVRCITTIEGQMKLQPSILKYTY